MGIGLGGFQLKGVAAMSSASEAHNAVIAELSPELDQLAIDAMADWKVPGAALAVVQDGKVALVKAYGQRDIDANLPVTLRRSSSSARSRRRSRPPPSRSCTTRSASIGRSLCAITSRSFGSTMR